MRKQLFAATMALLVLLSMSAMASNAPANSGPAADNGASRYDQQIQQAVSQKIEQTKQLKNVNASVEDGIVTLTGSVGLYQDKLDAAKKIKKIAKVTGVRNEIAVEGAVVPDGQLAQKLSKQLTYDRIGYFDNAFNYITADVNNGVVTLNGDAYWGVSRDDAMAIAAHTPGVKDVVDNVKVLPVSNFDDSIRVRTARAIYRDSVLSRYATDPADPIRIVVENGHITLFGSVQSTMDKSIAGIRASGVPGAFSVDNKLVVD